MGLVATGCLLSGIMEGMAICTSNFPLRVPKEIGEGGGLGGTFCAFGSIVAVAVCSAFLANRIARITPQYLYPAAEGAGDPKSSLPVLVAGLGGSGPLDATTVPSLTPAVLTIARSGYAQASAAIFRTIFFTSFILEGIGMILAWFVVQNDASKQRFVGGHIHNKQQERGVVQDTKMQEGVASLDCVKKARLNGTLPDQLRSARRLFSRIWGHYGIHEQCVYTRISVYANHYYTLTI